MATETKETGVNVQTWLPPELAEQLKAQASAERRSVSQVVRIVLEDQFRKDRW